MMTNIATQSSKIGHSVSVLADGSKSKSSSFDSQQNFEIKRFDQIKFFRNKIKSSFAYDLLKNKNFDLVFFDSWKSIEHFNGTNQIKKICLIHGNEILNLKKKERIIKSLKNLKTDYASILVSINHNSLVPFDLELKGCSSGAPSRDQGFVIMFFQINKVCNRNRNRPDRN